MWAARPQRIGRDERRPKPSAVRGTKATADPDRRCHDAGDCRRTGAPILLPGQRRADAGSANAVMLSSVMGASRNPPPVDVITTY